MAPINIPPTRSNLLRVKKDLQFAREGYEILNRKREVLTTELIRVAHDAEVLQQKVWKLLAAAYSALEKAQLRMGREKVEWAALGASKSVDVTLKYRSIMGVAIPQVDAHIHSQEMRYSPGDTTAALDEASEAFHDVLNYLPELSRLISTVWRLANELRKTQRRVNALQYIFIPAYEETVIFIQSSIEEREREDTFRLKLLKHRTKRPGETADIPELEPPFQDAAGTAHSE